VVKTKKFINSRLLTCAMPKIKLEDILEKARMLGIDLGQLSVVHLDDEPFVLNHTGETLSHLIREYHPFTEPQAALDYITKNSGTIDFLILDQFLTRDLSRIEGFQGTDILRKLQDKKIIIPAAIFSGDHARAEGYAILSSLNRAQSLTEFRDSVLIERKGMTTPVSYVPKTSGAEELLLNLIGLIAIKREFLDRGYEALFESMELPAASPRYDWAKLGFSLKRQKDSRRDLRQGWTLSLISLIRNQAIPSQGNSSQNAASSTALIIPLRR
jgi:hypothetical protein